MTKFHGHKLKKEIDQDFIRFSANSKMKKNIKNLVHFFYDLTTICGISFTYMTV